MTNSLVTCSNCQRVHASTFKSCPYCHGWKSRAAPSAAEPKRRAAPSAEPGGTPNLPKAPRKSGGWVWLGIAFLLGFSLFGNGSPVSGLLMVLSGVVACPLLYRMLEPIAVSSGLKFAAAALLFVFSIGLVISRTPNQVAHVSQPTETVTPQVALPPLYFATREGNLDVATKLIASGADVNSKTPAGSDAPGASPLHFARTAQIATFLLAHGARIDAQDLAGDTPLIDAASRLDVELCTVLLNHGANANISDANGANALIEAARMGPVIDPSGKRTLEVVATLLAHQADINARDRSGNSALSLEATDPNPRVTSFLLSHQAKPDLIGPGGKTPLHIAVENGNIETARILLNARADRTIPDATGLTLADIVNTGRLTPDVAAKMAKLLGIQVIKPQPVTPIVPSNWQYTDTVDDMRGTTAHYAFIKSTNELSFDFPYVGGSATFTLRRDPKYGLNEILDVQGQFICHSFNDDTVSVKFDEDPIRRFGCGEPRDGRTGELFIEGGRRFVERLKRAKSMTIEAEFYQSGVRQMQFDVSGLDWK